MAIDNSLYDSLENTYVKIQGYLYTNQLGPEHSAMIIKHEELAELLERLDIEAIEEQSKDINTLHAELNEIKGVSNRITQELNGTDATSSVVSGLDEVFSKISTLIV